MMFRILVLVGALAAGGVAAWLSFGLQPGQAPAATMAAPPQIETREVLVAAVDLARGATVGEQDLRWQSWPADAVNPGFISRSVRPDGIEEHVGYVARQAMVAGEPVHAGRLEEKGAGYLAAMLKPGTRAVAVRVSAESAAGGFILPNDHVDVLHTGGNTGGRSLTILTNVRVLAIDQNTVNGEQDNTALGKTATLELEPAQAEVISGAQATGTLSLALRATADNEEEGLEFSRRGAGMSVRIVRSGESQVLQTDGPVQ